MRSTRGSLPLASSPLLVRGMRTAAGCGGVRLGVGPGGEGRGSGGCGGVLGGGL